MPQVNVNLEENDAILLDRMSNEDGYDNRSAFVRRMIRLEAQRRYRVVSVSELPHPEHAEPVPLVEVAAAEAAKR
ncbi:MAG: ribbon-helix-helix protein, CopG family [Chloroflexota bacterium]